MRFVENTMGFELIEHFNTSLTYRVDYCPYWGGHLHHIGVNPDWLKEHRKEIREHADIADLKWHADSRIGYNQFSFDSFYTENHTKGN